MNLIENTLIDKKLKETDAEITNLDYIKICEIHPTIRAKLVGWVKHILIHED